MSGFYLCCACAYRCCADYQRWKYDIGGPDPCPGAFPSNGQLRLLEPGPDLAGMITEALGDPNIHLIGVCGKEDDVHMGPLLETIERRVKRDDLFGVIVTVSIGKKPDFTRIQQEIARILGFSYQEQQERTPSCCVFPRRNQKAISITENATQLCDRIRAQPKILFTLRDLHAKLDLAKLGIPFGVNHQGCKVILTSHSEEILSNQMNVQRTCRL